MMDWERVVAVTKRLEAKTNAIQERTEANQKAM
jgi:hypothetical protein